MRFSQLAGPWNYMLVLPQSEIEDILESRLAELGVRVERGVEWIDFKQDESCVEVTVRQQDGSESTIEARWLFAADGAHSRIRKTLELDFPGHSVAGDWSLADLRADLPLAGEGPTIIVGDRRLVFILRIRDDLFRIASNLPDVLDHLPPGSEIHEVVWKSDFTVSHRLVESYRVGRCCLAGDAAHIHSPLGGRGMNLGIEDACEFARLLDDGRLDEYHALRHARGKEIVTMVSRATRLMTSPDFGPRTLRRWLLPLVLRLPFVTKALARRMVDP